MTTAIRNHHNFLSDYWLGTLASSRTGTLARLAPVEVRKRLRRLRRLIDAVAADEQAQPARFRERFARPLLRDVFDFVMDEAEVAPYVHLLRASQATGDASATEGIAIAAVLLAHDPALLDRPASRATLDAMLRAHGLRHGFLLAAGTLRLVRRAGDGPRLGALDVAIDTIVERDDETSLAVAWRLCAAEAFVPLADGRRPIDVLEAESREHSARVSTELKDAVFDAAERLVGAFVRDVSERPDAFGDVAPTLEHVRDAGFLALYRILFILYAEARDERLDRHRLYRESYSLEGLVGSLLAQSRDTIPANRARYWGRVQALFRTFDEGLAANLPGMENIPPRGGRLFNQRSDEGKLLATFRVDDRTLADVLLAIATTRPRRGVGRERVSFRELEIEQLGSVYEGLLEYEPAVAAELSFEVQVGGREMVLSPENLVFLCEHKQLALSGDATLVVGTAAAALHPANVPDDDGASDATEEEEDEAGDDDGDADADTVKAGTPIKLVRRLEPGTFHFRPGGARKSSGSYYTPKPMVDYLVRETLGPLTDGKSTAEIEALRVIDLACGSAHFLVGAARFLGARLHEAYTRERGSEPPVPFASPGSSAALMRDRWGSEGPAWCRRRVVERCLYGVDLNPAAVQLAQVALWIESLAGDRPLSFFAHHIRVGNSLQGTFADRFDTPPDPQLSASRRDTRTLGLFESNIRQRIEAALSERRLIDAELPPEIRADSPEEFRYKEDRLRRSDAALQDARLLMDLRSAAPYLPAVWGELPMLSELERPREAAMRRPWWGDFERVRARERFFHWELEFPEVLLRTERPGFDVVLGNPPWDKVLPSKLEFYSAIDPLVIAFKGNALDQRIRELHCTHSGLANDFEVERERTTTFARVLRKGGDFPLAKPADEPDADGVQRARRTNSGDAHEDLAKYFVDRSLRLARRGGAVGLVIPAVVYNGDGCVGIRQHLLQQAHVTAFYGFENKRRLFPIHASYKFAALAARMDTADGAGFEAAFMRHDVAELADAGDKPWLVRVTRDEVEQLSPSTLAFLEFRGPRDQQIIRTMTMGRPTFGGGGAGAWGTRLISWRLHEVIFNATEDKDLFSVPGTTRLHTPTSVLGNAAPREPGALLEAMRGAGFWPVYEGKHIEQYLVGVKPLRWWLSVEQAEAKYERPPHGGTTLVFRETASNTNQRTCIAALMPEQSVASHTCTAASFANVDSEGALTVMNSMCFDFLLRLRSAGTHVSFTYIRPVAVPPAHAVNALPRIPTRFAPGKGWKYLTDDRDALPALWAAERAVAEAYGLGPAEFAHILETFPVWGRKRPQALAFYRARLKEWMEV